MGKPPVLYDSLSTAGELSKPWKVALVSTIAGLVPLVAPVIHMIAFSHIWPPVDVDRDGCANDCWDTVFKGPYESGVGKFKHVYFNSDATTAKMWSMTVIAVILVYESARYLLKLAWTRRLRLTMAILYAVSFYSHYFAWWAHWNYWNDEYHRLLAQQVFFSISKMIATAMVVSMADSSRPLKIGPLSIALAIALFHVVCVGLNEFVSNVLVGGRGAHQSLRDVFLMATDVTCIIILLIEVKRYCSTNGLSILQAVRDKRTVLTFVGSIMTLYLVSSILPSFFEVED